MAARAAGIDRNEEIMSPSAYVFAGMCITSPDEPSRGGGSGPECRAAALRPACACEAAASSKPVAADQGRRRPHPQPGAVSGQSRATA